MRIHIAVAASFRVNRHVLAYNPRLDICRTETKESAVRTNLPVTGIEYRMKEGQSIVSKTDTKGRITYINPSFIEVSGFSEEELLGKAHNIVRHPDMPPEAFADMWRTLQSGRPWTGMVKNRRKNGDFYWVVANVVPVKERGQVIGYMSVRTTPTREQVEAADALYRKFRAGQQGRLAIRGGLAVKTGFAGRLQDLRRRPRGWAPRQCCWRCWAWRRTAPCGARLPSSACSAPWPPGRNCSAASWRRCAMPPRPCTRWPAATCRIRSRSAATTRSASCCWRCAR